MASKRFNVWITDDLLGRVKADAQRIGIKASAYMRMAALEKLAQSTCQLDHTRNGQKRKTG